MTDTIDAEGLEALMHRGDVRLLNVLPASSFEKTHIPGSESVPFETLEDRAPESLERDEEIVVHCSGPDCGLSPRATRLLTAKGYERVRDFAGGLVEWIRSGRDVIRDGVRISPEGRGAA